MEHHLLEDGPALLRGFDPLEVHRQLHLCIEIVVVGIGEEGEFIWDTLYINNIE